MLTKGPLPSPDGALQHLCISVRPWATVSAVLLGLLVMGSCRKGGAPGSPPALPRTIDARLGRQVSFQPCRPLEPPLAELRPASCGAPLSPREGRLLARGRDPLTRLLAGVVVSSGSGELTRTLRQLESRPDLPPVERQLALGALEHALARTSGDPAYLIPAFEHNEAALATDPSSLVGLFNRGIIASDLGLCRLAARTWRQYQERDPVSGWGREAAARLSLLPCAEAGRDRDPSPDELFTNAVEELLPKWSAARHGSPAATETLDAMARLGADLYAGTGEPLVRDLARELASARSPSYRAAVAALIKGRERFEKENYEGAAVALRQAASQLRTPQSWLSPWIDIWLSGADRKSVV